MTKIIKNYELTWVSWNMFPLALATAAILAITGRLWITKETLIITVMVECNWVNHALILCIYAPSTIREIYFNFKKGTFENLKFRAIFKPYCQCCKSESGSLFRFVETKIDKILTFYYFFLLITQKYWNTGIYIMQNTMVRGEGK